MWNVNYNSIKLEKYIYLKSISLKAPSSEKGGIFREFGELGRKDNFRLISSG